MTILHYRVSGFDRTWVVSCEDVLIQAFDNEKSALRAATRLIAAARQRGDHPALFVGRTGSKRAKGTPQPANP